MVLFLAATLPPALATPITYTLTGYVQCHGGGTGHNADTSFTWSVYTDTSSITSPAAGQFQVQALSSSINFTDIETAALTGVSVTLDTNKGQITFGSNSAGIGLTSDQLKTWDLKSFIGPLNGANVLIAGQITKTDGFGITLTGVANTNNGPSPTFQASSLAPTVNNVQNAASNTLQGLPNDPIAQGSVFVVKGNALGPATLSVAPSGAAFQNTSLSGTSVAVTVGGTTVGALLYYTSFGQVAALLPSNTPTGDGTVTVTYNDAASAQAPVTVVANNLGLLTLDSSGQGPAIVSYTNYTLVSAEKAANCGAVQTPCGAANPGDTLFLWGTGLGPVNGKDASGVGLGKDMPNIPLKLWVGGVQAKVTYQGRSGCCVGEDQIAFTVPDNVPTGCAVPLVVQIGNYISNHTVLPLADQGSRNCTPVNPALSAVSFEQDVIAGPITAGAFYLGHASNQDTASGAFAKFPTYKPGTQPFLASWVDDQPLGTCIVYSSLSATGFINSIVASTAGFVNTDVGSTFTVQGPGGSVQANTNGNTTLSSTGTFLVPGDAYTVSGTGGADVHSFHATVTLAAIPALVSPANNATVTRANGLPVTWTGGDGHVQITIGSASNTAGAQAICTAPASAQSFTIPPYVLLALPAGNSGGFQMANAAEEVPLTAQGLTVGFVQGFNQVAGFGLGSGSGSFTLQ